MNALLRHAKPCTGSLRCYRSFVSSARPLSPLTSSKVPIESTPQYNVASTFRRQAASSTPTVRPINVYPEALQIFHAGAGQTAVVGMIKASTIVFFGLGCTFGAPAIYANPNSTMWSVLGVMIAAAIPMITVQILTAPFVAHILVQIPPWARKSEHALQSFVQRPAADTRLEFQALRFMPWSKRRTIRLGDLRTMSYRWYRMANIEHVPSANQGREVPWYLRMFSGQFFVRPGKRFTQHTRGPGVWDGLLENIQKNTARPGHLTDSSAEKVSLPQAPLQPMKGFPVPQEVRNATTKLSRPATRSPTPAPRTTKSKGTKLKSPKQR